MALEDILFKGGVVAGNFFCWLVERGVQKMKSRPRPQPKPPVLSSATNLPKWAQEVCAKAVQRAMQYLPEGAANAIKQPSLRLCYDLLRYEGYEHKYSRSPDKLENILAIIVYYMLCHEDGFHLAVGLIGGESEAATYQVPLYTLHTNIPQSIEILSDILNQNCNEDGEPFPYLFARIPINGFIASGIDPDALMNFDPSQHGEQIARRLVKPSQVRDKGMKDIISLYLQQTPFVDFFTTNLPVSIPLKSRVEHMHVVGGSGHGKTQLLQSQILADLDKVREGGRSVIVIDSQGDMINKIWDLAVVGQMAERVVLIDPTDIAYPPCLNLFDFGLDRIKAYDLYEQEVLKNGAIDLFEYVFGALLDAKLTNRQGVIFRYIAGLMMHVPNATIHTLVDFMQNPEAVRPYLSKLEPSAARFFSTRFFTTEFNETRGQILTRLDGVLSHTVLDRMFSHPRNKVNLFEAMNRGSLILINTAKDLLKQGGTEILGRFFIALICQAAQERAPIAVDKRMPTMVYIDEAHDYFDEKMENLLTQARKYQVGLVIAHQNLGQFNAKLRDTVMSNTSVKLVGGLSASDAGFFAKGMGCEPEFLQGMRKQQNSTQFACFVRNHTTKAIPLSVPFGLMEQQPKLTKAGQASLKEQNRARVCEAFNTPPQNPDEGQSGTNLDKPDLL